jgi:hypothetical protein
MIGILSRRWAYCSKIAVQKRMMVTHDVVVMSLREHARERSLGRVSRSRVLFSL